MKKHNQTAAFREVRYYG